MRRLCRASRVLLVVLAISLPAVGFAADSANGATAQELVSRTFENLYGFSSVQLVEIRSRMSDGKEFLRSARVIRSGAAGGLNRLLARLVGPPDLRGIGVLLLERDDFSYDAFMYQPMLQRVRRISVAQRNDPFFGTDVYFEDLEAKRAAQWSATLLRTEKVADRSAAVIELRPRDFPSGYQRIVAWFDQEIPVMLRADFYRGDARLKTLEIDPERIVQSGGYLVPTRLVFRSVRGSVTTVDVAELEIREAISEERFRITALEFGDERKDAR